MERLDDETRPLCPGGNPAGDGLPEELVAAALPRLEAFVRLRIGPRLRARLEEEDVVQETLLEAFRLRDRFRGTEAAELSRWLCSIAENRIRNLARHHGAARRSPEAERAAVTRLVKRIRISRAGPATAAAEAEQTARLVRAIEELAEEEREVLLPRFFAGVTVEDIAAQVGRSPTAVRRLLGRAVARLGHSLRGLEEDGHGG